MRLAVWLPTSGAGVGGALLEVVGGARLFSVKIGAGCVFSRGERFAGVVVHGGDFVFAGADPDLDFVLKALQGQ